MSLYQITTSFDAILIGIAALSEGEQIPESIVRMLYDLFGRDAERALFTMKDSKITLLTDEKGRTIFEVTSPNDTYYVYPNVFFCTCPAFKTRVLVYSSSRVCKHIIATRIAKAAGQLDPKFMSSEEMSAIYTDVRMSTTSIAKSPATASAVTSGDNKVKTEETNADSGGPVADAAGCARPDDEQDV